MGVRADQIVRWWHVAGHCYEIEGFAIREDDLEPLVLYRRVSTEDNKPYGPIWARPCAQFFDGRFRQTIDERKVRTRDKAEDHPTGAGL